MKKVLMTFIMLLMISISSFAVVPFAYTDIMEYSSTVPFGLDNYPEETQSLLTDNSFLYKRYNYFVLVIDTCLKRDYVICFMTYSDALTFIKESATAISNNKKWERFLYEQCALHYPTLTSQISDGYIIEYHIYSKR